LLDPEDEGTTNRRNAANCLPNDKTLTSQETRTPKLAENITFREIYLVPLSAPFRLDMKQVLFLAQTFCFARNARRWNSNSNTITVLEVVAVFGRCSRILYFVFCSNYIEEIKACK
jgi:hypothetical protein